MKGQQKKPSDILREWADKIDKNAAEDFSGAFVIIPPEGEPIAGLLVSEQDVSMFYAMVKTKLETSVDALNEAQRNTPGFR